MATCIGPEVQAIEWVIHVCMCTSLYLNADTTQALNPTVITDQQPLQSG